MRKIVLGIITIAIAQLTVPHPLVRAQAKDEPAQAKPTSARPEGFKPEQQASKGSVTIGGKAIPYDSYAGTIVAHPKGWDDVPQNADKDDKNPPTEASMFYVA